MKELWEKSKECVRKHQWIIVFLLAVPFLNDSFPSGFPITYYQKDFFKIISVLILIWILYEKKRKPSKLFMWAALCEFSLLVSTLINYPFTETWTYNKMFYDILSILFMGLLTEAFLDDSKALISGLMLNYEIAIYPCYINALRGTPGLDYYHRGLLDTLVLWFLPAIFIALLRMVTQKKYVRSAVLIIVTILFELKVWCATTIAAFMGAVAVMIGSYLLYKWKDIRVSATLLFVIVVLTNVFILFIYSGGRFALIDFFIEKILKKSTDFTQRNIIWKEAMRMIMEKPILGHGSRPVVYATTSYSTVYIHAHNQFLQKLNEGGIVRLILFLMFHVELLRKLDKEHNSIIRILCLSFLFGIWMTYIPEAYKDTYLFYIVFFISYHFSELFKKDIH